jgi:hypothetical protein
MPLQIEMAKTIKTEEVSDYFLILLKCLFP